MEADMNTLLNRLLDEVEGGEAPGAAPRSESRAEPSVPSSSPAEAVQSGGNPLGGLLANPALLAALPALAENLGPLMGSLSRGTGSPPAAARPHPVDRHTALLCAVKPYLSERRQDAAETVIRLCRVWDALERSGISLSGLLSGAGSYGTPSDKEVT